MQYMGSMTNTWQATADDRRRRGRFLAVLAAGFILAAVLGLAPQTARGAAPELDSVDTAGLRALLQQHEGKVVVLNFWASWCAPCRVEMPSLVTLTGEIDPDEVAVIGVSLDFDPGDAAKFARTYRLNFPSYHALNDVMGGFEVGAIPRTLIYDRAGRPVIDHVGVLPLAEMREAVRRLLEQ